MNLSAGWKIHFVVLGALAAIGIAITAYDYLGPSAPGMWISLRGVGSALYWLLFVAFAIASTISFAFLRVRVGVPLSYVLGVVGAIALGAVVPFALRAIEQPFFTRTAEVGFAKELASRLTLESWSMAEKPGGMVKFTATVRGEVDGSVDFEPIAAIGDYVAVARSRTEERSLKAGERAVLETSVKRTAQGAFDSFDLYFTSWVPQRETGTIVYKSDVTGDTVVGNLLKRPLPAPTNR